ncbi:MAG: VOC family protein [Pirellulaceae bacterium]
MSAFAERKPTLSVTCCFTGPQPLRPKSRFDGFRLSLALPTEADAQRAFSVLADGGEVQMPLTKTFFSPCFGMVTDRFGVGWMVTVAAAPTV